MQTDAENFINDNVGALETSHDFDKYIFRAYNRVASVLLLAAGGFIFIFSDNSKIKADSYGFNIF